MLSFAGQKIIVTGATGYIGGRVARALAQRGAHLILPVRARSESEWARRRLALLTQLDAPPETEVQVIACDLADGPAVARLPRDAAAIIHAAALTRFNATASEADQHNLAASRQVFSLAAASPGLSKLLYISTIYAAGEAAGEIVERPFRERPSFANHYERTKWQAETELTQVYGALPWQILRLATVIADDAGGGVTQHNAVHNTLKLLYHGLISLLPGAEDTPVYLVCGDVAEAAVLAALERGQAGSVYHVTPTRQESLTLGDLITTAFAAFTSDPAFARRGLRPPLLVAEAPFRLLVEGLAGFGSPLLGEALSSLAPFAAQLFITKDFATEKLRSLVPYAAPPPRELLAKVIAGLIAARWRNPNLC